MQIAYVEYAQEMSVPTIIVRHLMITKIVLDVTVAQGLLKCEKIAHGMNLYRMKDNKQTAITQMGSEEMDRETLIERNAIHGLETAIEISSGTVRLSKEHAIAILELLKKQTKTKVVFGRTKDGEFVTECGNCGTYLGKAYSNCPKCKKELDWNSNQT